MSEQYKEQQPFQLDEKYQKNYEQLQEIWRILEEAGLTPTYNYSEKIIQNQWDMGSTFPIANEGAQGIRITRFHRQGELTVSFTNGFENPNNPKRIEITQKLRQKGFNVV